MGLSTPEVEGSDLPGSPQEPAQAPTVASWMRPKPRGPVGADLPIRRPGAGVGGKAVWLGPRWPGAWFPGGDPTLRPY